MESSERSWAGLPAVPGSRRARRDRLKRFRHPALFSPRFHPLGSPVPAPPETTRNATPSSGDPELRPTPGIRHTRSTVTARRHPRFLGMATIPSVPSTASPSSGLRATESAAHHAEHAQGRNAPSEAPHGSDSGMGLVSEIDRQAPAASSAAGHDYTSASFRSSLTEMPSPEQMRRLQIAAMFRSRDQL